MTIDLVQGNDREAIEQLAEIVQEQGGGGGITHWHYGKTPPDNSLGKDGDFYFLVYGDTPNQGIFGSFKINGEWDLQNMVRLANYNDLPDLTAINNAINSYGNSIYDLNLYKPVFESFLVSDTLEKILVLGGLQTGGAGLWFHKQIGENKVDVGMKKASPGYSNGVGCFIDGGTGRYQTFDDTGIILKASAIEWVMENVTKATIYCNNTAIEVIAFCAQTSSEGMTIQTIRRRLY